VTSDIGKSVFAAGNQVFFNGTSGGDVIVAGNSVRVNGTPGDDVLAVGNNVRIVVDGADDILAAGSTVDIASTQAIRGDVNAAGGIVSLSGIVAGDVRLAGERLVIKSGTRIAGRLMTYGESEPVIEDNVEIAGEITHSSKGLGKDRPGGDFRGGIGWWVSSVIGWFILALMVSRLAAGLTQAVVARATRDSGKSLGLGLLWTILFIPVVILLGISLVGLPLALTGLFITLTLLALAAALAKIAVGVWIMQKVFHRTGTLTWQHVLLGVVVFRAVELIPVLGWLAAAVVTMLVMGALLLTLKQLLLYPVKTP